MEDKIKQEIVLDEKCSNEINSTFKLLSIVSAIYFFWMLFSTYKQFMNLFEVKNESLNNSDFIFNNRVIPILYLIQYSFVIIGIYFQYIGFKMQKDALEFSDSQLFLSSYKFLKRGLLTSISAILISIFIYIFFKFYSFST